MLIKNERCAENHVRTLMTGEIQEETEFFKLSQIIKQNSYASKRKAITNMFAYKTFDLRGRVVSGQNNMRTNSLGVYIYKSSAHTVRVVLCQ